MYQSIFGCRYIKGFKVDFFGWEKETERIVYESGGKIRSAKRHYTKAATGFGNPPPGTLIEYYEIILPDGKKARYKIYT